jgi:hypothetical protein
MKHILFNKALNFSPKGEKFACAHFSLNQLNYFKLFYSTNSSANDDNNITLIEFYGNADIMKRQMSLENKGKAGIYRWINKINGKTSKDTCTCVFDHIFIYVDWF